METKQINAELLALAEHWTDKHGYRGARGADLLQKISEGKRIDQWGGDWVDAVPEELYALLDELSPDAQVAVFIMGTAVADNNASHDPPRDC